MSDDETGEPGESAAGSGGEPASTSDAGAGAETGAPGRDGSGQSGVDDGIVLGVLRTVVPNAIRRRFALKFFLVLLVMGAAIGVIGVAATAELTDQTQDRIETEYSNLANQEATLTEDWLTTNRVSVRTTSRELPDAGNASLQSRLETRLGDDLSGATQSVHVINRTGDRQQVVASTSRATGGAFRPGASVAETNLQWTSGTAFLTENIVATSSVYRTGAGGPVMGFVSPISGSENRYVVQEVSISSLAIQFQGAESADGGFTQVVNASHTVVIDERISEGGQTPTLLEPYGGRAAKRPIREAGNIGEGPSGVIARMDANGVMDEEYAVGYAPIDFGGKTTWYALVHAPTAEVFGFVQTIQDWGYIATVAGVLLIGLMGAMLGYNTSQSIDRLTAKAERMEEGDLDVEISSGRIDNIGRLYDGFAEMRDALGEQIEEAEQARKEAEVSRAEAMEMNEYLQEKAEEYSDIMQACARGDLTRRMETEGENDAMDQIARDFNEMIQELEMTTGQLKTFAVEVEEGGRDVRQGAETVRDASEQVADSIQKISDDAYDQKERLQAISGEMDTVADRLEGLAGQHPDAEIDDALATIREVAGAVETATDLGEETMAESENVAGAAEEQAAELNEVSARADELVRYAQYLGDGLNNFQTEEEHEFVFQTGAAGPGAGEGQEAAED